jgi:RNAse (barnase) inhibitor barstar
MASLTQHTAALDAAWQRLSHQWQATSDQWRDASQQEFDQHVWQPLEQQVRLTRRELDNLISVLERAKHQLR